MPSSSMCAARFVTASRERRQACCARSVPIACDNCTSGTSISCCTSAVDAGVEPGFEH
jgi:hypothetical protein